MAVTRARWSDYCNTVDDATARSEATHLSPTYQPNVTNLMARST